MLLVTESLVGDDCTFTIWENSFLVRDVAVVLLLVEECEGKHCPASLDMGGPEVSDCSFVPVVLWLHCRSERV